MSVLSPITTIYQVCIPGDVAIVCFMGALIYCTPSRRAQTREGESNSGPLIAGYLIAAM